MSESFDPYLRWLGIRDRERPPNHYRLLGIDLFESDPDVIAGAADRQMAHVRTFQTGKFGAVSQQLLNELAKAKMCLLKPERKSAYDRELRQTIDSQARIAEAGPAAASTAVATSNPDRQVELVAESRANTKPGFSAPAIASSTSRKKSHGGAAVQIGVGAAAAVVVLVGGAIALLNESGPNSDANLNRDQAAIGEAHAGSAPNRLAQTGGASQGNPTKSPASGPLAVPPKPIQKTLEPPGLPIDSRAKLTDSNRIEHESQHGQPAKQPDITVAAANEAISTGAASKPLDPISKNPDPELRTAQRPPNHSADESTAIDGGGDSKADSAKPESNKTADGPKKPAAPSKDAQVAAEKIINELFKTEAEQATRGGPDAKTALAKKLSQQATDTADDLAARYVLLIKARDMFAAAGDVAESMAVVDKIAEQFAIDVSAERFVALSAMLKNVRSAEAQAAAEDAATAAVDEAILADNFESAGKFARLASSLATKLHNPQVVAQLRAKSAEVDSLKKEFAKSADAHAKLSKQPDDPEANQVVGFYEGAWKGDFKKALPYLAKGSDASLRNLASKETAAPTDPDEQSKLADGWWDAGEHQREPIKSHLRAHSVDWYQKCQQKLKGLAKAQCDSRIKQYDSERPGSTAPLKSAIVKKLTDGDWHIYWLASKTDYSAAVEKEYAIFKFNVDGSCSFGGATSQTAGKWQFLENDTKVEVTITGMINVAKFRFELVGDVLHCENYNPPTSIMNVGVGKKNPTR